MAFSTKLWQMGIKEESSPGTEETLVAADFGVNLKGDPSPDPSVLEYERDLVRSTLSKQQSLTGPRRMTLPFEIEMAGGDASTPPVYGRYILAAGFSLRQLRFMDVENVNNVFAPMTVIGNNASVGSATKVGYVVDTEDLGGNTTRLTYELTSGSDFEDADEVYDYKSVQADGDVTGSPADAGQSYVLLSDDGVTSVPNFTGECRFANQRYTIVGSNASNLSIGVGHGRPFMISGQLEGAPVLVDNAFRSGALLPGVPTIAAVPKLGGSGFKMSFDSYSPVLSDLTLNISNTLAPRPTLGESAVADSGYAETVITDRNVDFSIDPEHPAQGTQDSLNRLMTGATFPMSISGGDPYGAEGKFMIQSATVGVRGSIGFGNRNNIVIQNPTVKAFGTNDDEVRINHVFLPAS